MPPSAGAPEDRAEAGHASGLLEREADLEAIQAAVGAAIWGRGRLVVVEGPAGIGKSALLAAGRRLAAAEGLDVLFARGAEQERHVPLGVALELFEPAVRGERRRQLFTGASALAKPLFSPSPEDPFAALNHGFSFTHGLYWLLAELAEVRPVALVVDDAHWADAPTLRFLAYLASRVEGLPVTVVVALRPDVTPADPGALRHVRAHPQARFLEPAALTPESVGRLVREAFFPEADEAFCAAVHEVSTGNPFLARELLISLDLDGVEPTAGSVARVRRLAPEAVVRAVESRLAHLSDDASALAEAVAVLGEDAYVRHAGPLAGLNGGTARAADELVAADVLRPREPLAFAHPLERQAVYQAIPPVRRAKAHGRAGALLRSEGAAPERLVPHLLAAPAAGDPSVVGTLRQSARRAVSTGAPDSAVAHLRRALAEPPPVAERGPVLVELGEAEALAGDPAAVGHMREGVAVTDDGATRATIRLRIGRHLQATGWHREAARAFAAGVEDLDGATSPLGLQLLAGQLAVARSDPASRPPVLERAFAALPSVDDATPGGMELLGELAFEAVFTGRPGQEVVDLALRALAGGKLLETGGPASSAFEHAVVALTLADALDPALDCLDRAVAEAERRGLAWMAAQACFRRAAVRYRQGAILEAVADAERAVSVARERSDGSLPAAEGMLALGLLERCEYHRAGACLERAEAAVHERGANIESRLRWARAELALEQGAPREALSDVLEVGRILSETLSSGTAAFLPWRSAAARALAALGERDRSVRLATEEVEAAEAFGTPGPLGTALCALGLSLGGREGLDRLREAVDVLALSPARLERARAAGELGAALRRAGHRKEAQAVLRDSLDLAEACGSLRLAARLQPELRASGARPRRRAVSGPASLTPSEQRVACLAAEGLANKEIAQRLFVSVKAVEWHLGNAFAKLGISSRQELAGVLGA